MRGLLFSIISFALLSSLCGQDVCTGNLGENIFTIGDFGTGPLSVVQTDPGIAPGYSYTAVPPPADGFYVLTNDMTSSAWQNLYGTWLAIGDNSDDPEGYMMVVNASFEPGIFYVEEVTGLCENTLYEFSADVINLIRIGVGGHHEPNLSFLLDDVVQYSTGLVPQDAQWHKHGFTFTTGDDQTSVNLSLRNNAPGGIGNDLALDNISFRPCGPNAFAEADQDILLCANGLGPVEIRAETDEDAAIQWQFFSDVTQTWNDIFNSTLTFTLHNQFDPGVYRYRYLTAGTADNLENEKCRVISDEATVTVLPIEFTVYDTICEGTQLEFGTQIVSEEGMYEETFLASSGCDSFVDLFLTIVPDPGIELLAEATDPACFGENSGSIFISEVNGGAPPYDFFINNIEEERNINNLSAGTYILSVEDKYRCSATLEVDLNNPEAFVVDLGADTTVEFGAIYDFQLTSSGDISNGLWMGLSLECTSCVGNSARPFENGQYVFSATNAAGCTTADSIFISVKPLEDIFYQPNVFSPNEDGVNDRFQIFSGTQAIASVKVFSVYDRYGSLVYTTRNRNFQNDDYGWDGNVDGSPAASGIYAYLYQIVLINDAEITVSGDLTLVR